MSIRLVKNPACPEKLLTVEDMYVGTVFIDLEGDYCMKTPFGCFTIASEDLDLVGEMASVQSGSEFPIVEGAELHVPKR